MTHALSQIAAYLTAMTFLRRVSATIFKVCIALGVVALIAHLAFELDSNFQYLAFGAAFSALIVWVRTHATPDEHERYGLYRAAIQITMTSFFVACIGSAIILYVFVQPLITASETGQVEPVTELGLLSLAAGCTLMAAASAIAAFIWSLFATDRDE